MRILFHAFPVFHYTHTHISPMERFDIVDTNGTIIGEATRADCHAGTFLLHPVVHVFVFRPDGRLILQKRSMSKYIQPGRWDTSVGGHIHAGESTDEALLRESDEELGLRGARFEKLYTYIMESDVEREYVTTFRCVWNGPLLHQQEEIDELKSFSPEEIEDKLGIGFFTPNFEEEWERYKTWLQTHNAD